MLILIEPSDHHVFMERLDQMFRQRARVFNGRLGWDVTIDNGRERDQYDAFNPTYMLYYSPDGMLRGSVRFLPMTGPNMLRDTFPQLLDGAICPESSIYFESSRFAVETEGDEKVTRLLSRGCVELFLGGIEYGLAHGKTELITVTDVFIERLFKHAGWDSERIGDEHKIGNSRAVAVRLPISTEYLHSIRKKNNIHEPVLWTRPVGAHNVMTESSVDEQIRGIYASLEYLRGQAKSVGMSDIANQIGSIEKAITKEVLEHGRA
ncbi:acyl-homoserine-lactone synthase [Terasakiella sp. SH-1]|uniref:acyl-homoserine-lactone synthase n=1 Tax=Terasakiella sp. SH-1 TaxID=2560057 RepID=UPI0010736B2A|nr:acyl-homoserine-lactone synthase [Terasakiella sp. SH-1]